MLRVAGIARHWIFCVRRSAYRPVASACGVARTREVRIRARASGPMRNRKRRRKYLGSLLRARWHRTVASLSLLPRWSQPLKRRGPVNRSVIKDMYSAHIRGFRAGGLAVDRNLRAEPSDGQRGRQRLNHDEDAKRHPEPKPKHLAEQDATHTESSDQ